MHGTLIKALSGFYYVEDEDKNVWMCRARGVFKKKGHSPLVGDTVSFDITHEGDEEGFVTEIDERKNSFIRPPVANVDCFVVVVAAMNPAPAPDVIDRFLVMAEESNTDAIICITKTDLAGEESLAGETIDQLTKIYRDIYPVYHISSATGEGMKELEEALKGKGNIALAGPSGAGKSSLINALIPKANAETGKVSKKTRRGKNTTRHVELFSLSESSRLFDTPGFTSIDVAEVHHMEPEELQLFLPEFAARKGQCKYDNCMHLKEPECAIRYAVKDGSISESRYRSYEHMLEDMRANKKY